MSEPIITENTVSKFWCLHQEFMHYNNYRVYSNRTQAKKIISNLVCAQLESKQFQEVNFLALIRCCVVVEQSA